ncbi:hypothetical protein ALC56_00112, partial [Trachymyrmex septentrionalis]
SREKVNLIEYDNEERSLLEVKRERRSSSLFDGQRVTQTASYMIANTRLLDVNVHVKYHRSLLKSWISFEKGIDTRPAHIHNIWIAKDAFKARRPLTKVYKVHYVRTHQSAPRDMYSRWYGIEKQALLAYLVMQPAGRRTDRCIFHDIAITLGKRKSGPQARRARDMHRRRQWGRENEK